MLHFGGPKTVPRKPHEGPKTAPRTLQQGPGGPRRAPGRARDARRASQSGASEMAVSDTPVREPMRAPRGPKESPKGGPRGAERGPKMPPIGFQSGAFETAVLFEIVRFGGSKRAAREPRKGPKRAPRALQEGPGGPKTSSGGAQDARRANQSGASDTAVSDATLRGPMRVPRRPQERRKSGPRGAGEGPKRPPTGPRSGLLFDALAHPVSLLLSASSGGYGLISPRVAPWPCANPSTNSRADIFTIRIKTK